MLQLTSDEMSAILAMCEDIIAIFGDPDTDGATPMEPTPAETAQHWPHMLSVKAKLTALLTD